MCGQVAADTQLIVTQLFYSQVFQALWGELFSPQHMSGGSSVSQKQESLLVAAIHLLHTSVFLKDSSPMPCHVKLTPVVCCEEGVYSTSRRLEAACSSLLSSLENSHSLSVQMHCEMCARRKHLVCCVHADELQGWLICLPESSCFLSLRWFNFFLSHCFPWDIFGTHLMSCFKCAADLSLLNLNN